MNIIIARQKFSAHPIYLSFSKYSYRQNICFDTAVARNFDWEGLKIGKKN